jgi:hypothetical protein
VTPILAPFKVPRRRTTRRTGAVLLGRNLQCPMNAPSGRSLLASQAHIAARAMQAAMAVARQLDIGCSEPTILRHSQHVSIRLFPSDVVARVLQAEQPEAERQLCRELAVARHLVQKGAPVVGPTSTIPAGPYFQAGFAMTLWPFVKHVPADDENREHMASGASALRRIHSALADFPDELPSVMTKIAGCRDLLEDQSALPALAGTDRAFLLKLYKRLMAALNAVPFRSVPIHGDPGPHNVFITAEGALYSDFENASLGPREWDIGFLAGSDPSGFEPINRELYSILSDLRSLCVSVWCWDKYERADKREAAEYHLQYLKEHAAA